MADYIVKDTELTSVANAIRTAGGTSSLLTFPNGFISAINNISTYTKIVTTGTLANIITQLSGNTADVLAQMLLSGEAFLNITATLGQDTARFACYSVNGVEIFASLAFGAVVNNKVSDLTHYWAKWNGLGELRVFSELTLADDKTWTETPYYPMASAVNCTAELIYLGRID